MGQYTANATNTKNFTLLADGKEIGELIYEKWYSFKAEIRLTDGHTWQLEPKGFWDAKIELKDDTQTLLEFKMGWKGIIIKTQFDDQEKSYLLALKGLLSNKFVLLAPDNEELMVAETHFKWRHFNFDYTIETSNEFDSYNNKELFLLTILHCINYYQTMITAAA